MSYLQDKEKLRKKLTNLHTRVLKQKEELHLATVSGVATTQVPLIRFVDRSIKAVKVITTKSFQVVPNPGNREPIICEIEAGSFGNSVGLRNSGMDVAYNQLKELRETHQLRALLNVSVSGSTIQDFLTLVGKFEDVADIIELNFSCPHAASGYGSDIGSSKEIAGSYVTAIKEKYPNCKALIFAKLTPNVPNIGKIAKHLIQCGIDGLVAINTVGPVIHIDPTSKKPILQNALGGKGGKSGKWIFNDAVYAIREIRKAVGENIPIIGMGGVCSATDIKKLLESGGDVIGIGSALAKVNQANWQDYFDALNDDFVTLLKTGKDPDRAAGFYNNTLTMGYEKRRVVKSQRIQNDTLILTLEGTKDFEAGEFVFLWLPQIGEKPFSIALSDPLTFVIKRKGKFTEALFDLKENDELFMRGLYGKPAHILKTKEALLIAGGSGVAVLPALAKRLKEQETKITTFVGVSESGVKLLEKELKEFGEVTTVSDEGVIGRVLNYVEEAIKETEQLALYIVGPTPFMREAVKRALKKGVNKENIYLSLEQNTLCGVGMCGECLCGERLTCQWGTFIDYPYIEQNSKDLL